MVAGVAGLCSILALGSLALLRAITRPLHQAIEVARRIAGGDVGGSIPASGLREMAELLHELGRMQAALVEHNGNQSRAAQSLGLTLRQFAYRLRKAGLK